jgi:cobalamin biosynthesis protein CobT
MKDQTINLDAPIGALKTQLSKLLLSVDRIGWATGCTSGRFDVRRTGRMLAGSERVFRQRTETPAVKTSVSIIIDMSGSMASRSTDTVNESRIGVATQCAYAIATAVERSNCEVEVVCFGGGSYDVAAGSARGMYEMDGLTKGKDSGKETFREAKLYNIKKFDQKAALRRRYFERLHRFCNHSTPDYHAVRSVAELVAQRTTDRKLVIVLTDGFGDDGKMKQFVSVSERLYTVPVLGIGIQTYEGAMRANYDKFAVVQNLQELSEIAIRALIAQIEAKPSRAAAH